MDTEVSTHGWGSLTEDKAIRWSSLWLAGHGLQQSLHRWGCQTSTWRQHQGASHWPLANMQGASVTALLTHRWGKWNCGSSQQANSLLRFSSETQALSVRVSTGSVSVHPDWPVVMLHPHNRRGDTLYSDTYGETIWAHLWDEISLDYTLHHPVHLLTTILSLINMNDNSHFYCFHGSSLRTNRPFVAQYIPVATIKRKAASVTWLLDECSQGGRVVSYYSCWWWTSEQNH